jgi:putative transposase
MDFCSGVDTSSAAIGKTGRKRETDLREILNALRYMARSAGGWRMLPKDFPPWQTVY